MFPRVLHLSKRPCTRTLHYILQRDTNKTIPKNDIFIRTPDTAPVLKCLNYPEIEAELKKVPLGEVVSGTFVVQGLREGTNKMMRKERGVATLVERVNEIRVLAVCDVDSHVEALANGATQCLAPDEVARLTSVEDFETVVCTTKALGALRPLGRILRTKMPHERRGTVAPNINSALRQALLNVDWEMADSPNHPDYYNVTLPLIKSDFPAATIKDHVDIMFSEIMNFCPAKNKLSTFIERLELVWSHDTIHVDIREHTAHLKPAVETTVLKKRYSREETWALREAAKDRSQYLEEEKAKIAGYLEDRWEEIERQS